MGKSVLRDKPKTFFNTKIRSQIFLKNNLHVQKACIKSINDAGKAVGVVRLHSFPPLS